MDREERKNLLMVLRNAKDLLRHYKKITPELERTLKFVYCSAYFSGKISPEDFDFDLNWLIKKQIEEKVTLLLKNKN